jgi:inhibitor of cysteine peptidase
MQKEIKKRMYTYGVVAVLSAIVLGALCYNFGVIPEFGQVTPTSGLLKTFASEEELRNFLTANSKNQGIISFFGYWDANFLPAIIPITKESIESSPSLKLYSTTNIQVAGVDEADIVKTDGEYIYLIANSSVFILKAYPPDEAEVLSRITFNGTYPVGIFIDGNSDRLAVLGSTYTIENIFLPGGSYSSLFVDIKTSANIYDISDKTKPTFLTNFTISGSYFDSRMIGDYVYFIVSQPAYIIYDTVILPKIYTEDSIPRDIKATDIYYSNASDDYYLYTTIVALNMKNLQEEPTSKTIMMAGTGSMYVSLNNIYVTFPEWNGQTSIYRIRIENTTISPEAKGEVSGNEINQFSMDEYDGYFRIATTEWVNGTPQNNLYVLNMNLSIVGSLENFAPLGERMDSARFIENRCYLSTSTPRKDPFFVIDVGNATQPKILGNLSIPGFTRYLHPYDEDYVIGVGVDGNYVKIMLFNVTNVNAPVNMSEYKVTGCDWSDTPVFTEHKAFLFDRNMDLLVMPIITSTYDQDQHTSLRWQNAYVFNITLNKGIVLKGNITHQESGTYSESDYWINRALYIENVLYTLSNSRIKMNNLETLELINEIELP